MSTNTNNFRKIALQMLILKNTGGANDAGIDQLLKALPSTVSDGVKQELKNMATMSLEQLNIEFNQ